jgi:hypothetical protein
MEAAILGNLMLPPLPLPRLLNRCLALIGAGLFFGAPAGAVIIDFGDGTGNTSAPAEDPGWKYVGLRAGLTAVYLGNGWVATANHVAAGEVVLDGTSYPAVAESKIQIGSADLAVFQIDPAPAWDLLPISSDPDITGATVILIGQGRDRGAAQTACLPKKNGYLWAGPKTKRWGENVVFEHVNVLDTDSFFTVFDKSGLTYEAQAADGDSGGGVFVKNGGDWELAGLMYVSGTWGCQPANSAFYANTTYASDLAAYRDVILPIVRPQCSDELDNDGDLLVDYPDDPDCNGVFDDREKSPLVPSLSPAGLALLAGLVLLCGSLLRRRKLR